MSLLLTACLAAGVPDTYDRAMRAAVWTWWPPAIKRDWCELKARAMVESSYREDAVSPAGALGLLQVMPFNDPRPAQLLEPRHNINVAARLSASFWDFWSTPRPLAARRDLERASYNAGPGNIWAAQRLCGMALDWEGIAPCLPRVTGRHSQETFDYVERSREWKARLGGS